MVWQLLAVVLLLIFYGCYFLKMAMQHRQGIRTDQLGKGKIGFVLFVEVGLKLFSILVPLAQVLCIIGNQPGLPVMYRQFGVALAALGDLAFVISVVTMQDNWRAGVSREEKTELVTSGIYRWSRNPAFLGFILSYIGILLMFYRPFLMVLTGCAILFFHLQIVNVEEPFLQETFGEEYLSYQKKTCRYFGRKM